MENHLAEFITRRAGAPADAEHIRMHTIIAAGRVMLLGILLLMARHRLTWRELTNGQPPQLEQPARAHALRAA